MTYSSLRQCDDVLGNVMDEEMKIKIKKKKMMIMIIIIIIDDQYC